MPSHLGFLIDQGLQHLHSLDLHNSVSDKPLHGFEHREKPSGLITRPHRKVQGGRTP